MKSNSITWSSYMGSVSSLEQVSDVMQLPEVRQFTELNERLGSAFAHSIPAIFLLDYTTGQYITMSNWVSRILSNGVDKFLDGGIGHTLDIYHKEDLRVFDQQIFPERLAFMNSVVSVEYSDYLFSYNFRLRNRFGHYVNVLQRSIFLNPDRDGNPTLSFGVFMQIGDFGKREQMLHTIEKMNAANGSVSPPEVVFKKTHFLKEENSLFSKREREVLLWMAEGLSCKQIADKLCLSEHTIINHKRHMLEKTGCLNSVALVSYAIRAGII